MAIIYAASRTQGPPWPGGGLYLTEVGFKLMALVHAFFGGIDTGESRNSVTRASTQTSPFEFPNLVSSKRICATIVAIAFVLIDALVLLLARGGDDAFFSTSV